MKDYELWVHWKQGDDCSNFITQAGDVKQGLLNWAENMEYNVKKIRRLVDLFGDKDLDIDACTHSIILNGDEDILKRAVEEELIDCIEYDEEEGENIEEDLDLTNKSQFKEVNQIVKNCIKCEKELTFQEFYDTYGRKSNEEKTLKLWSNNTIHFFCCSCFRKMKCKSCDNYLEFIVIDDILYFFCRNCVVDLISKIQDNLTTNNHDKFAKNILKLNNMLKNVLIEFK
ncbi:MAG: hypothetical protein KGD63_02745 [Candidatus Lokiarchaeota archaeon]|nr:hypothetical protein [Candidatus Lokiarchaeota archaeon]